MARLGSTVNKGGADFFIAGGADENKFSLSGTTLTFEATDFEARDDKTYHGSGSSIYISSTESAKQKVGTLVIGKNDLAIDKDGIVDLDIGVLILKSSIITNSEPSVPSQLLVLCILSSPLVTALGVLTKPFLSK
jgi:hypothetical protein